MNWARELQAIGQTGLHFAASDYDRERYRQVGRVAAEILARHTTLDAGEILRLNADEFGYATPKVDVRGVVVRDGKVLLVHELADPGFWTLPGGWADVNETPSTAVEREILEESGFETRAVQLLAVYDRDAQGHSPPHPYHVYKLFFRCELLGGEARPNLEADQIDFFDPDRLPPLSESRVLAKQIQFALEREPDAPAVFD